MQVKFITREDFVNGMTGLPEDKFEKRFLSKADSQKLWTRNNSHGVYKMGVFINCELAGAGIWTFSKNLPRCCNMQLLMTFNKFRGKGIAKTILTESINTCSGMFSSNVMYYRISSEPDSVSFYEKQGIKFLGRQKSGTLLSIGKLNHDSEFPISYLPTPDSYIQRKIYSKAKGGCVEIF